MKLVLPKVEMVTPLNAEAAKTIMQRIEIAARTCYKSEDKITDESAEKMVKNLIKRGHEAMIEHAALTVKVTCDRGVSHEIVRHRIGASYGQESTRYVNYVNNDMQFICPNWFGPFWQQAAADEQIITDTNLADMIHELSPGEEIWFRAMMFAENEYRQLVEEQSWQPQQARSILPNSLKTEIVMTYNMRAWRHFFELRLDKAAHPQMRQVAKMIWTEFNKYLPIIFGEYESLVADM
jgi:thymidylate synthase (FAD)